MYAVFLSGSWWSSLSNAIKNRLSTLDKVMFVEETIWVTSHHVIKILFNDIKKLDSWKHKIKPRNSQMKKSRY
jgi:hypothetical protein